MKDPCGDGTVLYLEYGGDHMNLHVIKLHKTKHTHTHTHTNTNECVLNWWNLNNVGGLYPCKFPHCSVVM